MRRLAMVALVAASVGLGVHPAGAATTDQLQTAINHVRVDVSHLNDYATHKVKFLKVQWCRDLAKHARALGRLDRPQGVSLAFWTPTMTVASEYELAGQACVRLQIPETNAHLTAANNAVQEAAANDPTHRRFR